MLFQFFNVSVEEISVYAEINSASDILLAVVNKDSLARNDFAFGAENIEYFRAGLNNAVVDGENAFFKFGKAGYFILVF